MKALRCAIASLLVSASPAVHAQDCERIGQLFPLLEQWHGRLESWRGGRFLTMPSRKLDADCGERIRTLMQWKQALEKWRRAQGLDEPREAVLANCRRTMQLLARWRYVIEGWYGGPLLAAPDPAACAKRAAKQ